MNNTKNVFLLTNTLLKGGAEKQCIILSKLLKSDCNITVVILDKNKIDKNYETELVQNNINLIKLENNFFTTFLSLYRLLKKNENKVVISYLAKGNVLNALCAICFPKSLNLGGFRSSNMERKKMIIQRFLHNHFLNYTICNSYEGEKFLIENNFKPQKIKVIPNTIAIPEEVKQIKNEELVITTVGRFDYRKDYFTALLTIKELIEKKELESITFKYKIVGYGELEQEINDKILELNLEPYIEIYKNVNPLEVLKTTDIYLSTSIVEGMSNSIMEALSYKLPVVATDVGDNKKLINTRYNGFIEKVGDYESLGNRLTELLLHEETRLTYGANSLLMIKNNFSEEQFKNKYITLMS